MHSDARAASAFPCTPMHRCRPLHDRSTAGVSTDAHRVTGHRGVQARPRLCREFGRGRLLPSFQPGVQDSDHLLQTMHVASRDEGLTARDRSRTGQGVERGQGELCLREREPRLVAQPSVPARRGSLEPPRLLIEGQQHQRQGVRERYLRKLRRQRPREQEVSPIESALELAVRAALRGHEHMFACSASGWSRPRRASCGCSWDPPSATGSSLSGHERADRCSPA
jgi:hypothetical protein